MMRRRKKELAALVTPVIVPLAIAATLAGQAQTARNPATAEERAYAAAERVAKSRFPEELRDPSDPGNTDDCVAVYDSTADGTPATIFAVYPETMRGVLGEMWVFLKNGGDQYTAMPVTPSNFDFGGAQCTISMIDGGAAHRHHIMVSLSGEKSSGEYIFDWDGHQLTNLGPTVKNGSTVWPGLTAAEVIHLYQGGVPGVLSKEPGAGTDPDDTEIAIYRFDGTRYVREGRAILGKTILCGPRSCSGQSPIASFSVEARSRGPYLLRVANGNLRGQNRVSGIRIAINGVDIVRDGDLDAMTDALAVRLAKLRMGINKIAMEVQPRKDHDQGELYVFIEDLGP